MYSYGRYNERIQKKVYTKFIDKRFYYLSLIKESNGEKPYSIHGLWPQNNEIIQKIIPLTVEMLLFCR